MQEQHIDIVVLLPFTDKLATLSPEQFVAEVLCDRLAARHIVVGSGFVFGHRRSGTLATLEALGGTYGFDAHGVSAYSVARASSRAPEFARRSAAATSRWPTSCSVGPFASKESS
jgi:FAD synthase